MDFPIYVCFAVTTLYIKLHVDGDGEEARRTTAAGGEEREQLLAWRRRAAMGHHHHHLQLRRLASAFAVLAAVLCVVIAVHEGGCCAAAARPLVRRQRHGGAAAELAAAAMDVSVAPAAPESAKWAADGVVRAGKWLPLPASSALAGGLRFPGVGVSMPWMAGSPPAFAGPGLQLVPPYVGATRQEQISLWASLFNPFQVRPRLPAAETTSSDIPAIAGGGQERTTVDEPAGEPKWGIFLGNNNNGN